MANVSSFVGHLQDQVREMKDILKLERDMPSTLFVCFNKDGEMSSIEKDLTSDQKKYIIQSLIEEI